MSENLSRRQLGRLAADTGTLAVAAPLLAACGSGSGDSGGSAGSGGKSPSGDGIATSSIPVGGGTVFGQDNIVVTQPSKGTFEVFSATCTHQGCQVGQVTDGKIVCPCHGSQFSIKDGSVVAGPAPSPLPKVAFHISKGEILPS